MRSNTRRSQLDHERYMRNRSERLQKQKEYYQEYRDHYLELGRRRYLK